MKLDDPKAIAEQAAKLMLQALSKPQCVVGWRFEAGGALGQFGQLVIDYRGVIVDMKTIKNMPFYTCMLEPSFELTQLQVTRCKVCRCKH